MSRNIDLTKRLSEDELRYLVDRDMWDALRENARNLDLPEPNLPSARGIRMQVPRRQLRNTDAFEQIAKAMKVKLSDADDEMPESETPGGPEAVDYNKLTVPQLQEEMDKRRAEYEEADDEEGVALMSYKTDAKKADLVNALKKDDEEAGDGDE